MVVVVGGDHPHLGDMVPTGMLATVPLSPTYMAARSSALLSRVRPVAAVLTNRAGFHRLVARDTASARFSARVRVRPSRTARFLE